MSGAISPPLRFLLAALPEPAQQPPLLPVELLADAVLVRDDVPLLVLMRRGGLTARRRGLRARHAAGRAGAALHAAPLAAAGQLGVRLRREHLAAQLVLAVPKLVVLAAVGQGRARRDGRAVLRQGRHGGRVEVFRLRRVNVLAGRPVEVLELVPPRGTQQAEVRPFYLSYR